MTGLKQIPEYKLTRGDVRFFLSIMLPALVELLLSQVFGMIDTIMLGRLPDSAGVLAAVGITTSPINLVVCVVTAFCIGTTATIAIATGAGKHEEARSTARQSLMLLGLIGVVLKVFCMAFAGPIIRFAGAKDEIFAGAVTYYRLIAAGFFFQSVTISITAALRGVGITRIPLLYNLSSAALNVVLNYIMIYGKLGLPPMGIAGAALATTVSKGAAFLAGLGWDAGEKPLEIREVMIPETFDEVYERYNDMQKEEGYDLEKLQGETVTLYTYEIRNHPSGEDARANLLILENRLVGGDICSVKVDGFCHGIISRPAE